MSARLAALLAAAAVAAGCQYALSDVATRIRYALAEEQARLQSSRDETATLAIDPDHWPDGCPRGAGYRLTISPYKGGKQVPVGDIDVRCQGGRHYYTGLGSEQIRIAREMAVEKKAGERVRITLRKTATGVEIVALE